MPKICEFETCRNRASYGLTYGKGIRCKLHKENYKPQLDVCHCGIAKPSFNKKDMKPEYCIKCKTEDMVNVFHKLCNCGLSRPVFNLKGLPPKYCVKCKTEEMVDVVSKFCKCGKKQAHYNKKGLFAEYCSSCKTDDMINVSYKKCSCGKNQPKFNINGQIAKYCSLCKTNEMIDVKTKRCFCGKGEPNYNLEGGKPTHCSLCKTKDMINLTSKKCFCGKALPSFNLPNLSPKYCSLCKTPSMIDLKNKRCKANLCLGTKANTKYKGYCANCYQNLFPNDSLTIQMKCKTKELAVRDYINLNFSEFKHDTVLWTGNCDCTHRRRIDHRQLIGNTLLCIETDENQHKGYNKKDEEMRYDDLYMIHSGKFIFIRFNPDKYVNENGKTDNTQLYKRLPILGIEIKRQIDRINNEENKELIEIIKLFYDHEIKNTFINKNNIENTHN